MEHISTNPSVEANLRVAYLQNRFALNLFGALKDRVGTFTCLPQPSEKGNFWRMGSSMPLSFTNRKVRLDLCCEGKRIGKILTNKSIFLGGIFIRRKIPFLIYHTMAKARH